MAQGAAQAVEDAATLAIIISSISQRSHIRSALQTYESIRKRRCELIQATAMENRKSLHLPDGPDQQLRDQLFAKISVGGENPDKWGDPAHQQFLWGWDAQAIAHAAVTTDCVSGHFRL